MTSVPQWARRSAIWGSDSTVDSGLTAAMERKLHITHYDNEPSEAEEHNPMLEDTERRIALEVYESRANAAQPRLEVIAFEQVISKGKVIHSTQIGSCVAIIFNRERALNNSFEITTENLPFQLKLFIECAYTSSGKLLPSLVEPAPNPFDQRPINASSASAASNHALVGEHNFVLIERIDVCAPHRRHGIGSKMLAAVLADAQAVLPAVRFAVSWPCASDVDLVDMGFPAGAKFPPGLGQQRAEDFHHAVGFRKLGLTRFWAMAL